MLIVNPTEADANWQGVLLLWEKLGNWVTLKPNPRELKSQIRMLLIALWNEKDWLKAQYPDHSRQIENYINQQRYTQVVGDLANTVKHRVLSRARRSNSSQTGYYGRATINNAASRQMIFIRLGDGQHVEILQVLRGALEELSGLRLGLRAGTID